RKPARSASTRVAAAAGVPKPRYPRCAILGCCCARATSGHANNAVPPNPSNSRRLRVSPPVPVPEYGSTSHLTNSSLIGNPARGELPTSLRPSPPKDRRDTPSAPAAPRRQTMGRVVHPHQCQQGTRAGLSLDDLISALQQ